MLSSSRAFSGMKRILFQPFDIKKWFVLGFSAWLAQLLEGGGSSGSTNADSDFSGSSTSSSGTASTTSSQEVYEMFTQWIQDHIGTVIAVASLALILIVAIFITLVWVRSRGKFMFLDNVVHNRYLIKVAWHDFREQGDSLCRWTLGLVAVFLGIFLLTAGVSGWYVVDIIQRDAWTSGNTLSVIGVGLVVFVIGLVWAYISILLENFIVPLMYRHRITATQAWRKFLPLHREMLGQFILYALWIFLLSLCLVVVVIILGFATCCIGFIILSLPYLSVVILLPAYVYLRLLGPDFLRQFGEEFDALAVETPPLPNQA